MYGKESMGRQVLGQSVCILEKAKQCRSRGLLNSKEHSEPSWQNE
jgi:hypothetical protein